MIVEVRIEKINPNPWQTRLGEDPAHIAELADDIEKNGLLQMPVGRFVEDGVELAFGHSRLAAFKLLADRLDGYRDMPVDVRELSDEQMATMAWAENEKRRDVTPIERAKAIEKRMAGFHWTQDQVAEKLGVSRPVVSNALRLLKLPEDVQDDLQHGRLTERQALALLPLYDLDPEMVRAHKFEASIDLIVELARGGASSDDIRQRVTTAVDWLKGLIQPALVAPAAPEVVETLEPETDDGPVAEELAAAPAQAPQPPASAHVPTSERGVTADKPTPAPQPSRPAPSGINPAPQPAPAPAPAEPLKPLTWDESTLVLTITLLPNDASGFRPAMIGLRANGGPPEMRYCQAGDWGSKSTAIAELMEEVKKNF